MTELPENVKNRLKGIRESGDIEFAAMAEHVVQYYIDRIDEYQEDPSLIIDYLADMLYAVNEGLEEEKECQTKIL